MKPAIVMPLHDPPGLILPHVQKVTPLLRDVFDCAYVSMTAATAARHPAFDAWLDADPFFCVLRHPDDLPVGRDFLALYTAAATAALPDQVLHLCFPDRVSYSLQSGWADAFVADMRNTDAASVPLIYHRSPAAWDTHPRNYRDFENMVTVTGEWLFGKTLDFAWCHLSLTAAQLRSVLPHMQSDDLSMVAAPVICLHDTIRTREVDWLAWEDPFILGRDPAELKAEREASPDEVRKRLNYVIPMLELIRQAATHSDP
jgi:hypothetical protein